MNSSPHVVLGYAPGKLLNYLVFISNFSSYYRKPKEFPSFLRLRLTDLGQWMKQRQYSELIKIMSLRNYLFQNKADLLPLKCFLHPSAREREV